MFVYVQLIHAVPQKLTQHCKAIAFRGGNKRIYKIQKQNKKRRRNILLEGCISRVVPRLVAAASLEILLEMQIFRHMKPPSPRIIESKILKWSPSES